MPVVKHEPDFAELVDRAAERKNRSTEKWNNAIYDLYGATIDPITLTYRRLTGKINPNDIKNVVRRLSRPIIPDSLASLGVSVSKFQPSQRMLKNSSLAYMLIIGPLMYPRMLVIFCAILTLLFRLSDNNLRENTASLSDTLDLIINAYFLFEGVLRLLTIPAVFEIRRRHYEADELPANSLTYEILRCGWLEIVISLLSIAVSSQYDSTNAICWFNLFRLSFIANFFVLELPQIEVLLSGIYTGLRSIVSTWFLLMIAFVIYGVLTTACFRENDPAHFSTVGTSMFSLFRVSTMDNWSQVNYINAYGCDSVDSEYVVIAKNDTRPRSVDVISGRMYLFLCDSPTSHPYLSSMIFTSFVVLTGFMLISLTVAAVSGGVHSRLEQIQKQQFDEDFDLDDEEYLESLSDAAGDIPTAATAASQENQEKEIDKEIRRTMRTHTFYGTGQTAGGDQLKRSLGQPTEGSSHSPSSPISVAGAGPSLRMTTSTAKMTRMASFQEDSEEDEKESDSTSSDSKSEQEEDPGPPGRMLSWLADIEEASSETNSDVRSLDVTGVGAGAVGAGAGDNSNHLHPPHLPHVIRAASPTTTELTRPNLQRISSSTDPLTPSLTSQSSVQSPATAAAQTTTAKNRKTFRSNGNLRRNSKEKLPLLQDKELIRMMLRQMWSDVEKEKEKRLKEEKEQDTEGGVVGGVEGTEETPTTTGSGHFVLSPTSSVGVVISPREAVRRMSLSPAAAAPRLSQPNGGGQSFHSTLQRGISFRQDSDPAASFSSSKRIAYFFRSSLDTYFYIGSVIAIVLATVAVEIYCTNKDNCHNHWAFFVTVQVLLSLDIIVRVLTYYPTYKTFFHSHHNLFDLAMVLIIWIPIFYRGYGAQIAESARVVYLLRLLPLLSWITDLQVIMLSIESSLRPLLYVVGMMFLMFFHFAVAGVLIFKKNDEFYFGTLYRAMNALFQASTLDNWGDIALKNMYGCDYYGFGSGVEEFDDLCQTPQGLGWVAAWYFIIFISLSVMIFQSLFVGIIISATELLKDGVTQEADMWKVIYQKVEKYGLQNSTLMNLLDIFNALDVQLNGLLTESELEPLLRFLPPIQNLSSLIAQVGTKVKGHVTFPEFIELLHFIGLRIQVYKPSFHLPRPPPSSFSSARGKGKVAPAPLPVNPS